MGLYSLSFYSLYYHFPIHPNYSYCYLDQNRNYEVFLKLDETPLDIFFVLLNEESFIVPELLTYSEVVGQYLHVYHYLFLKKALLLYL